MVTGIWVSIVEISIRETSDVERGMVSVSITGPLEGPAKASMSRAKNMVTAFESGEMERCMMAVGRRINNMETGSGSLPTVWEEEDVGRTVRKFGVSQSAL
jgi:hypothetical protein